MASDGEKDGVVLRRLSSSVRGRLSVSLAATTLSRGVTVAYNLVLMPILLSAWGAQIYGEWVLLTAVAAMASLSNVGIAQASASEIVMRVSAGDREQAQRVLSTTVVSLELLVAVVIAASALNISMAGSGKALGVIDIPVAEARAVVVMAIATVLAGFFTAPLGAATSAILGAGIPQGIQTGVKICELIAVAVVVRLGGGPIAVAGVLVLSACSSAIALLITGHCVAPWLRISLRAFDTNTLGRLLHPSLGYFVLFASVNILAIQLPRIVLGHFAGAETVAAFAVSVTYVRAARALGGIVAQSSQVELSRGFSEGNVQSIVSMAERICQVSVWGTVAWAALLLGAAGPLFALFTAGRIPINYPLLVWLLAGTVVGAYSDTFQYFLAGINRVWPVAVTHCVATLGGIAAAMVALRWYGVQAMAAGLALPEIATAAAGLIATASIFSLRSRNYFLKTVKLPFGREWRDMTGGFRKAMN